MVAGVEIWVSLSLADYQAWRDQPDWTARKHALWERGERLSSQHAGEGHITMLIELSATPSRDFPERMKVRSVGAP